MLLPGVGAFGAAMRQLREQELVEPLRERLRSGWPTLAVCIGLQLLCETSEEDDAQTEGLMAVPATVRRFPSSVRVPHMGWNRVTGIDWIDSGYAYFANSYRVPLDDRSRLDRDGWNVVTCEYGGEFAAALTRDGVLACQFHPELSGAFGLDLLRRWVQRTEEWL